MSGHSKWSTIKRQKGAADAKRGQLFTRLTREIAVAARTGLPDPEYNFRLRLAVDRARAASMPKENIDRAIARAAGEGAGDNWDEVIYEGYGPGGAAVMVLAMTDNRNRTVGEIRAAFTRSGGALGENGSVGWLFDQVGLIVIDPKDDDPDDIALTAIDAGAADVVTDDGEVEVYTDPQELHTVQEALRAADLTITSAELTRKPKTTMTPDVDLALKVVRLVEKLEDLDDVQEVYTNLELTDEVMEKAAS